MLWIRKKQTLFIVTVSEELLRNNLGETLADCSDIFGLHVLKKTDPRRTYSGES